MSKKLFINFIKYLSVFGLVFFCGARGTFAEENSSLNVESRVSATAKSGEITVSGPGEFRTGDASASVKSKIVVNGNEEVKVKTEARAEAQGENSQASVEVNGEKAVCAGDDDGCEVEISSETELAEEEKIAQEEKLIEETIDLEEIVEPKKGFGQVMQDFFSGMAEKVWSWL